MNYDNQPHIDLGRYAGTYGGTYDGADRRPQGFWPGFFDGLGLGALWRWLDRREPPNVIISGGTPSAA